MANWSAERQDTADKLIEALEQDRFVLHSQEIRPLKRADEVPYREILIRFLDEEETLLPPGTFIPVLSFLLSCVFCLFVFIIFSFPPSLSL